MSNRRRVRWRRAEPENYSSAPAFERAESLGGAADENAMERAARTYGLPAVPDAASAEDEALTLLEIAAEAEHGLMAQYLYGALGTKDATVSRVLRRIAIEEMGHLLTVQNLRLLLGGSCYLRRQDESPQPDYDPYPLKLEPLTANSLAKYVAAEAAEPTTLDATEQAELAEISRRAGQAAGVPLIHRVALIYMRLFYLFQVGEEPYAPWPEACVAGPWGKRWHVADQNLKTDTLASQGMADEWIIGDAEIEFLGLPASDRGECCEAIHQIAQQGEGSPSSTNSHFIRLRAVYRQADQNALPIYNVPEIGTDVVDAEPAATLSRLFDARYELLLINLQQMFLYARDSDREALRSDIIDWCRSEMRFVLAPLHRDMVARPRRPDVPAAEAAAAPAYHMPAAAVPADAATLWIRLRSTLGVSDALVAAAKAQGVTGAFLARMAELDQRRRNAAP